MPRTAELAPVLAMLALSATALVGCTAAFMPEPDAAVPAADAGIRTSVAEPGVQTAQTPEQANPESCSDLSQVYSDGDGLYWERHGTLRDLGEREFARGDVAIDDDGTPVTYTVEAGDVMAVVAERLCAYPTLDSMNHRRDIHPGQVLWLTPAPEIPWIPYYSPHDAPAGFQQIPYQQAIEAAGAAVDAGDVQKVRAIWNDTLKGMFTDRATIDAVQQVVDSGDLDALRQVFS